MPKHTEQPKHTDIHPFAASRGPKVLSVGRVLAASGAAALIAGGVAAGAATALTDAPQPQDYVVEAAHQAPPVKVLDPDNVLSAADETRMIRDAQRIDTPASVKQIIYLVFKNNRDNVNDTVEEYLRDNHPELIGDDVFPNGELIVGVGLDPRQAFVLAGEDLADQFSLREDDSHLEDSLEAIKPGVKDGNIPAGLFAGADMAVDAQRASEAAYSSAKGDRIAAILGSGGAGAGVAGATMGAVLGSRRKNQKIVTSAREDWDYVSQSYASLAGRLDQIDIRAHSLQSSLVDAHLRDQWATLRHDFLQLDQKLSPSLALQADSPDEQFAKHAFSIGEAKDICERVEIAEGNIDKLHGVENANAAAREHELYQLRKDLHEAELECLEDHKALAEEAQRLQDAAGLLSARSLEPDFMDHYLVLLHDAAALYSQIEKELAKDNEAKDSPERPGIDSPVFFAGVGYHGLIPYSAVSSWNTAAIASQSSSSSSVNGGFSSGFSGAGGSSSF